MIADYGTASMFFNRRLLYWEYLGLWLNRARTLYRKSHAVSVGVKIGRGKGAMGMDYYRAVTDSEAEAKMMRAVDNLDRGTDGS